jgi:adenosylcobyric acid synthase
VVPYLDVDIDDEDSLSERLIHSKNKSIIDIAVVRLPRISNFTDFNILSMIEEVSIRYVEDKNKLGEPDMIIIPGTKNTIADLKWLKKSGLADKIKNKSASGTPIFGICGGYQMLGKEIIDKYKVEGGGIEKGLNLINSTTIFNTTKTRTQGKGKTTNIEGFFKNLSNVKISGYEIHMGETVLKREENFFSEVKILTNNPIIKEDGYVNNRIIGTYLHGIFDNGEFTKKLINTLLENKGHNVRVNDEINLYEYKNKQYDKLAYSFRESVDMDKIYKILKNYD